MAEQLSLEGLSGTGKPTDRLFYAIFPDAEAAAQIQQLALRLRAEKELKGKPLLMDRFHVTLHHLGDYWGKPPGIVTSALEAASLVEAEPFEIVFDRVESFRSRPRNKPLVLRGSDDVKALIAFQKILGTAMERAGLGRRVEKRFTPHTTLLYDDHGIREQPVNPISWTVREFALVHSRLGRTEHILLGRWPLVVSQPK
jgi:RNA 2',3'-cyclic 3'-phosphodiesterase